ncbi:hypothetical protein [Bdellovibrio sp. HCB-110]|uniref:hypothetical protein n=1 Tax=Bdellovibrio sp. HCB-110 TaxID=3391182 RepID=UPI0039B69D6F
MNIRQIMLILFSINVVGCGTFQESARLGSSDRFSREPAASKSWNFESFDFKSEHVSGACDFSSPSVFVRRSNIRSNTVLLASTSLETCLINIPKQLNKLDGAFIEGFYSPNVTNKIKIEITLGKVEYAETDFQDSELNRAGYMDVHLTGRGIYKIKPSQKFELTGVCSQPELVGIYGFRRLKTNCRIDQGNGSVTLVFD